MKIKSYMNRDEKERFSPGEFSPKRREFLSCAPETLTPGGRLRRERLLRKSTLEEMSEFLEVSPAYLGAIERGKRPVSTKFMQKLHDRLGISYDFLFDGIVLSGNTIAHFVQESSDYSARHNIDVLLDISTPDELDACYNLFHTYLSQTRQAKHNSDSDSSSREN